MISSYLLEPHVNVWNALEWPFSLGIDREHDCFGLKLDCYMPEAVK